jgi:hypothetical protein
LQRWDSGWIDLQATEWDSDDNTQEPEIVPLKSTIIQRLISALKNGRCKRAADEYI